MLRFEVADTGIGIPGEARDRLFQAFSQADGSTTRKYGGTGLGLRISKQLAELMGGSIGVESEPGKGSEFWFTARFRKRVPAFLDAPLKVNPGIQEKSSPEQGSTAQAGVQAVTPGGRMLRVLVAEDNVVNQKVALRMLTRIGCRVDVVANGQEAVDALQRVPYDIVFMDCNMPELDGFAATAAIRSSEGNNHHTVIIAMTANALKGDREKCLSSGMDDYISKPVSQKELAGVVGRWSATPSPAAQPVPEKNPAVEEMPAIDASRLDELAELGDEEDPHWLTTILQRFEEDASSRVVKLVVAAETGNAKDLEQVAHALKGSCGNVGATTMAAIAHQLQILARSGTVDGAGDLIAALEREFARVKADLGAYATEREQAQ